MGRAPLPTHNALTPAPRGTRTTRTRLQRTRTFRRPPLTRCCEGCGGGRGGARGRLAESWGGGVGAGNEGRSCVVQNYFTRLQQQIGLLLRAPRLRATRQLALSCA